MKNNNNKINNNNTYSRITITLYYTTDNANYNLPSAETIFQDQVSGGEICGPPDNEEEIEKEAGRNLVHIVTQNKDGNLGMQCKQVV